MPHRHFTYKNQVLDREIWLAYNVSVVEKSFFTALIFVLQNDKMIFS